jgi:hypothetical protein
MSHQSSSCVQGVCRLVLLDNIGSQHWVDRAAKAGGNHAGFGGAPNSMQRVQAAAAHYLRRLMADCRVAVVASRHAAVSVGEQQGQQLAGPLRLLQREYMTQSWQVREHASRVSQQGVL